MRGLLSVSFGTSHEDTRVKTIDAIDALLQSEFSDFAFYSAWTSGRIIEKVKAERGEHHDTLAEAFARLTADGVVDLVIATTCLMKGGEMAKIKAAAQDWMSAGSRSAYVSRPLLATEEDRRTVANVVFEEFSSIPEQDALVLMGHGSTLASNTAYREMQNALQALGRKRFFVATVEGEPTFDDILPLVVSSKAKRVWLAPLMFVAGDHAKNDLAGDCPDSWKSRLEAQGLEVEVVLKGLGEYEGIRQLICDHVKDALVLQEVSLRG